MDRRLAMGIDISQSEFPPEAYEAFAARLEQQLQQLSRCLASEDFGVGPASVGSELELYIVDEEGRPALLNQTLLDAAADPQLTLELNRYNLEFNLTPQTLSDRGLIRTEQEMATKLTNLGRVAEAYGVGVVPIGILPTLQTTDFGPECLTDRKRYHALVHQLVRRRGGAFSVDIDGREPLRMTMPDVTLEGANTSFQFHWRIDPADYAGTFNAVQLITPLTLALSANSPGIFGHDLWEETRVPLFKQAIDTRHIDPFSWREPARVSYGQGWVRQGPMELFEEVVRLFPPLLPVCAEERQDTAVPPELAELRLHQSTVWLWNRPIYDSAAGGHLRIEMRALPAGPTPLDMVAGAAFTVGLAQALKPDIERLLPALPFALAERNFYRAAQHGLDAEIIWPRRGQNTLEVTPIHRVIGSLLPLAESGLAELDVSREERDRYLSVIEERLTARVSGARWQQRVVRDLMNAGMSADRARGTMLQRYRQLSAANEPVARWPA